MREGKKSYPRSYRIAALVRQGLSPIISTICSNATVTVRRISLNRDFSVATVYYSVLGGDTAEVQEFLTGKAAECRKRLAANLNMRATPKLIFTLDTDGIAADHMQKLLDDIAAVTPPPDSV
ncbi:MAG: ribosome-binding factor A [Gammaproteobacteria bacterium WSBS_2016_MAG_OTU1]